MGIIRNLVLKATIKRTLLDVTEEIENLKDGGHVSSFREGVMTYLKRNKLPAVLESETWEGCFGKIIAMRTQSEIQSTRSAHKEKEMKIFLSLVAECVSSKGGNAANIYQEFQGGSLSCKI